MSVTKEECDAIYKIASEQACKAVEVDLAALRKRVGELEGALREVMALPSDDPMDATDTVDGYTLTPWQQALRRARRVLGEKGGET